MFETTHRFSLLGLVRAVEIIHPNRSWLARITTGSRLASSFRLQPEIQKAWIWLFGAAQIPWWCWSLGTGSLALSLKHYQCRQTRLLGEMSGI